MSCMELLEAVCRLQQLARRFVPMWHSDQQSTQQVHPQLFFKLLHMSWHLSRISLFIKFAQSLAK
jgi:hypothetical protein